MKKENKWPLWYKGCSFWCGPIKNIKNWFKNLHYFFVRGRMGWAPSDVWDMDMYLGKIIPEMLRHLATYHAAYPYQYKGINKEKDACTAWETDLYNLAQQIEFVAADRDNFNPYAKQFYNFLENKGSKPITNEQKELSNKFYEEDQNIYSRQADTIKEAMTWLGEHWFELWD